MPRLSLGRTAAVLAASAALLVGAAAPAPADPSGVIGGNKLAAPGVVVDLSGGAAAPPALAVESWLIADATTGEVLAAKNAHLKLRPASTLKTLTALALMPKLNPNTAYTAVYDDAAQDGSKAGVVPGATYSVNDLLHGMMLPSGNDAAHALGNVVGGPAQAAALLNAEAKRIGAFDTVAMNTSGLEVAGQVSSAYDLALIQAQGLENPAWRALYGAEVYDFPGAPVPAGQTRSTFKIYTKNKLILNDFPGAVGGKTGYTTVARRTYVGAVERDGHTLVAAFMKYETPTEQVASQAFTWAFANLPKLEPVGELVEPEDLVEEPAPTASATPSATPAVAAAASDSGSDDGSGVHWGVLVGAGLLLGGAVLVVGGIRRRPRRVVIGGLPKL